MVSVVLSPVSLSTPAPVLVRPPTAPLVVRLPLRMASRPLVAADWVLSCTSTMRATLPSVRLFWKSIAPASGALVLEWPNSSWPPLGKKNAEPQVIGFVVPGLVIAPRLTIRVVPLMRLPKPPLPANCTWSKPLPSARMKSPLELLSPRMAWLVPVPPLKMRLPPPVLVLVRVVPPSPPGSALALFSSKAPSVMVVVPV